MRIARAPHARVRDLGGAAASSGSRRRAGFLLRSPPDAGTAADGKGHFMTDVVNRVCAECGQSFVVTAAEQQFLEDLAAASGEAWTLPRRCLECRVRRRRVRYGDPVIDDDCVESLTCIDCNEPFVFGGRDKAYFAQQGFDRPKRCRPCRRARAAAPAREQHQ